ncbi:uncharacterized protein PpBr36_06582 [Pyricularia pennisetigena]|uniref:uncharacterized protein n=1 Tax=Pyricularia pennisetigena TaxID=1578925 RepID=UPI001150CF80|nr:uncharacterized protein PpBr36_06582 [Pyricularia pennisetigena]TLS23581.1 hypothetical protein PpBr36_06582 [Pyricularia pennisetigena]
MSSEPQHPANNGTPPQDVSTAFFARDNDGVGPWWRLPIELQHMVLRRLGETQLYRDTGKAAHWFLLDCTYCTAPAGKNRIRNLNVRDRKTWLPEHLTSFMRFRTMEQPNVRRQPGDNQVYWDRPEQFDPWGDSTGYFGRHNPSMSRRRRNLFRTRIPGHAQALRRIIRGASGTNRPFIFSQLPRPQQLDPFVWLSMTPRQPINGLKPSAPPEDPNAKEGFSYMVINTAEDLVIIQNKRPNLVPLPDPRVAENHVLMFDHYLVSSVYTQFQHQRQIGYEVNLAGGEQTAYEDPTSPDFGEDPDWHPLFWSVVHFPRLETVWLINYNLALKPGRRPRAADRRFQARGLDLYEVARPTEDDEGAWHDCLDFVQLAEKFETKMLTHWQAWCHTRLWDEGGRERAYGGDEPALTIGNDMDANGNPKPDVPAYQMVTDLWNRRVAYEPEYWERLAPAGPTPRIRVKVLAVIKHGEVDDDCRDEDAEEELRRARLPVDKDADTPVEGLDEDGDEAMEGC